VAGRGGGEGEEILAATGLNPLSGGETEKSADTGRDSVADLGEKKEKRNILRTSLNDRKKKRSVGRVPLDQGGEREGKGEVFLSSSTGGKTKEKGKTWLGLLS